MAITGYYVGVGDWNLDLAFSKCEHAAGCFAVLYKDGQNEATDKKNAIKCIKAVSKIHAKESPLGFKTMAGGCAKHFPTLKNSPFHDDLFSFAEEEEEEELDEEFMMMWTATQ